MSAPAVSAVCLLCVFCVSSVCLLCAWMCVCVVLMICVYGQVHGCVRAVQSGGQLHQYLRPQRREASQDKVAGAVPAVGCRASPPCAPLDLSTASTSLLCAVCCVRVQARADDAWLSSTIVLCCFSGDCKYLATHSSEPEWGVTVWSWATGKVLSKASLPTPTYRMSFNPMDSTQVRCATRGRLIGVCVRARARVCVCHCVCHAV